MPPHYLSLSAVLAACLAPACAPAPPEEATSAQRHAISGGSATGTTREPVVYVTAEVRNVGGTPLAKSGSGSLVAPNLLLTALHVVSRNPSNTPFGCNSDGTPQDDGSAAQLGTTVDASKVAVFAGPEPTDAPLAHGVRILSTGSTTICENDLAFVVLDRALDLPRYSIRRRQPSAVGDELVVVGYGAAASDGLGKSVRRSERHVTVEAVGQWIRTFTVTSGPCEGDSGGPALSEDDQLVGVFSSVSLDCTGPNASPKYTDLGYFAPLVEQAFVAAGAGSPWPEMGEAGKDTGAAGASSAAAGDAGASGAAGGPTSPPADESGSPGCQLSGSGNRSGLAWLFGAWLLRRGVSRRRSVARLAHTKMHDLRNNP